MVNDDLSKYINHIAYLDMPLECKMELLRTIENIMRSFVDRAFGDDSVQLAIRDGDETKNSRASDSLSMLASTDHASMGDKALTGAFAKRAGRAKRKENC